MADKTESANAIGVETSEKIRLLRLTLIFMVVITHANIFEMRYAGDVASYRLPVWAGIFVNLFSVALTSPTMAMLFLISAYLLFSNYRGLKDYPRKLWGRVQSLVLPLVIWNLAAIGMLSAASLIRDFSAFFSGAAWALPADLPALVKRCLGIGRDPFLYHFWLMRDLFLLTCLAPVFHFLLARFGKTVLVVIGTIWILNYFFSFIGFQRFIYSTFCFAAGSFLAIKNIPVEKKRLGWLSIPFLVCAAMSIFCSLSMPAGNPAKALYLALVILGVPVLWETIGRLPGRVKGFLAKYSALSFFIFAGHEPLLTAIRKLLFRLFAPGDPAVVFLFYLLAPSAALALLFFAGIRLRQAFPGFFNVISGGRKRTGIVTPGQLLAPEAATLPQGTPGMLASLPPARLP